METIVDGIVIGGAGGAIAGITVWFVQFAHDKVTQKIEGNRIYNWLKANTTSELGKGDQFKSTRDIASWNNLTEDRVRCICSIDKRIFLCTEKGDDMWGIYERETHSTYEARGLTTI
ncbi:MAG: hypothetical protein WC721_18160 [Victivallaceae bacterium]|jgi:hypothetical protein